MKVKEKSEIVGLKFNIQKTKIMASAPIISWQIGAETVKTLKVLFLGTPESLQMVTAAIKLKENCPHRRKALTNLGSILKSRGITLPTNVHLVKAMVFPMVMYV